MWEPEARILIAGGLVGTWAQADAVGASCRGDHGSLALPAVCHTSAGTALSDSLAQPYGHIHAAPIAVCTYLVRSDHAPIKIESAAASTAATASIWATCAATSVAAFRELA